MFKLLLGFIPGLIWLAIFLYRDRRKPEPGWMIAKIFLYGMLITPAAVIVELAFVKIISGAFYIFLIIAPTEELLKYLVFKLKVAKAKAYDEPIDAMIYMITIALGFATVENIILLLRDGSNPLNLLTLRFLSATLLHALSSGIVGYFIGMKKPVSSGLFWAIAFHGVYNYIALLHDALALPLLAPLLIFVFIVVSRNFKKIKKVV